MFDIGYRKQHTLVFALLLSATGYSQAMPSQTAYPKLLPYSFSNFVWWSDDELRTALKRRIPGLQDEIAPTLSEEQKVRRVLIALLAEKGIRADIQIQDPPQYAFTLPRVPGAPAPSISFKITSPQVLVNEVIPPLIPVDLPETLQHSLHNREKREYASGTHWLLQSEMENELQGHGYLDANVTVEHSPPVREANTYNVDLLISVHLGPQYHIAEITADGGPLLQGRDLSSFYTRKVGDTAGSNPFGRLAGEIRAVYWQTGYSDVEINASPVLDRASANAAYHLTVNPGVLYHLRTLAIRNLTPDQESRVRELLDMHVGDVFDESALSKLSTKLETDSLMKGLSFTFSPRKDRQDATVDLTLDFFKTGTPASVSVR